MHITDWYATYSGLGGADPADPEGEAAGMPPVDSIDVWPLISGTVTTSPREELFMNDNCLIEGDWKLITGSMQGASWPGPTYPNASTWGNAIGGYSQKCDPACLFNVGIDGDMTEHEDLAEAYPDRVSSMSARLKELVKTKWTNKATPYTATCQDLDKVVHSKYGGFYGPFCEIEPLDLSEDELSA